MKAFQIIRLVILLSAILGLVVILCLFMTGKMSYKTLFHIEDPIVLLEKTQTMDGISTISLDISSSDIYFSQSDSNEIEIVYRGPKKYSDDPDVKVSQDGDTISITQDQDPFPWGFSFTRRIIEVKIPANYQGEISIESSSGDVSITGEYLLSSLSIKLSSGDIRGDRLICDSIYIKNASGDYAFSYLEADEITLIHSSGDTKVDSIIGTTTISSSSGDTKIGTLTGKTKISVTSGDIKVSEFAGYGEIKAISGDIHVTVLKSEGDLSINSTSGEIGVTLGEDVAYSVFASCTSGDVSSDYDLSISENKNSASGEIGDNPSDQLTMETISGDIHIA